MKEERGRVSIVKRIEVESIFEGIRNIETNISWVEQLANLTRIKSKLKVERAEIVKDLDSLRYKAEKLFQIAGRTRPKRGALDIGGEVLKLIFGTMDNRDAKRISQEFKRIHEGQNSMDSLMNETISIVKGINEANQIIKRNQEQEQIAVNRTIHQWMAFMTDERRIEGVRRIHDQISRWIMTMWIEVNQLHEALLFLTTGAIDPYILDWSEVKNALIGMGLGYEVNDEDEFDLYDAAVVNSFMNTTSKSFYVVLGIPTASNDTSELYSVMRIPQSIGGRKVIINESDKFFLASGDKRSYWQGNEYKFIRIGSTIIGQRVPMLALRGNVSCEASIFQYLSDGVCEYQPWNRRREVEIVANEGYLLVWFGKRNVEYNCDKEKGNLTISEPTMVKMGTECAIQGDGFTLSGLVQADTKKLADLSIRVECCSAFDKNITYNDHVKVIAAELQNSTNMELKNITDMSTPIKNLEVEYWTMREDKVHPLVLYGAPSLVLLIILSCGITVWILQMAWRGDSDSSNNEPNHVIDREVEYVRVYMNPSRQEVVVE